MPAPSQNNQTTEQDMLISYLTIRRAVGILGATFPAVLYLGVLIFGNCPGLKDSVSSYYYTAMGCYFSGTLCAVGLFLFTYKGYPEDRWVTNAGGVFALCIVFFRTNVSGGCVLYCPPDNKFINAAHYISAALFFISMAYLSGCRFTKTEPGKAPGGRKLKQNKVYKTCAIVMLIAMVLILTLQIKAVIAATSAYRPEFWLEAIVLLAFGISWLTKGKYLIKD
jgi:hypothetical protein